MKVTVWTLTNNDDNGVITKVFATQHEAYSEHFKYIYKDETARETAEAKQLLDARNYGAYEDVCEEYMGANSIDTYAVASHLVNVEPETADQSAAERTRIGNTPTCDECGLQHNEEQDCPERED